MELDSVLVHVTTYEEMRRLTREGAEIWQEWRDGLQWDGALMRVPAAVAIRLCLIMKGAEFGEVAQRERGRVITPRLTPQADTSRRRWRMRSGTYQPVQRTYP